MNKNVLLVSVFSLVMLVACNKHEDSIKSKLSQNDVAVAGSVIDSDLNQLVKDYFEYKTTVFATEESSARTLSNNHFFFDKNANETISKELTRLVSIRKKSDLKYLSYNYSIKINSVRKISTSECEINVERTFNASTNQIDQFGKPILTGAVEEFKLVVKKANDKSWKIAKDTNLEMEAVINAANYPFKYAGVDPETEIPRSAARYTYIGAKVAAYCALYAMSRNPSYPDFENNGGDCTNFASQCMRSGGWPDISGSYSSTSAWNFANRRGVYVHSHTWVSASKFYSFLKGNRSRAKAVSNASLLRVGDVIQINYDGNRVGHTLVVSSVDYAGRVYISCHTNNKYNYELEAYKALWTDALAEFGLTLKLYYWQIS